MSGVKIGSNFSLGEGLTTGKMFIQAGGCHSNLHRVHDIGTEGHQGAGNPLSGGKGHDSLDDWVPLE